MTSLDRRRFMQLAGGTAALSALSTSIARAAEIAPDRRTGTLRDVDHVVVLMQENRSFDHYLGTLRGVRGFGDPRPVSLPNGKPVWYQSDGTKEVLPFRPRADNLGLQFIQDLNHDWNGGHEAWNQGRYDRWVPAKTATTMAYLTREDIPFHYALADTFTICDAYHCSLLGPTDPNRYYMWTGCVGNNGTGGGPVITNAEAGYSWTTYPERLDRAGVSWKIYQDVGDGLDAAGSWGWTQDAYIGNYGDNSLLYFDNYRQAKPGDPLHEKARTGTNAKSGQGFFDILKADVMAGRLPQVSWIAAPEAFTEHPNWPANYGAWYISQVLDALTANPKVWARTALFITYDENDGFFDHVVPPYAPPSEQQGASTVDTTGELFHPTGSDQNVAGPYGLGQRVPMFVVSPWSKGGWVCSEVFDHTSIIRFMERRFGVHEPNISAWRRTVCGDLTSAFDFDRTDRKVPRLPDTSGYFPPDRNRHPDYVPTPPAQGELPKQEPGLRPARPLPYDLSADARLSAAGELTVDFASHGPAGASFHVTSADGSGPWSYTVESGRRLTGQWHPAAGGAGDYDLTVHGPGGFLRRFAGRPGGTGLEVTARHDGRTGEVRLVIANSGPGTVRVTITDAYGSARPAVHRLRPGARTVHLAPTRHGHGWYDLTVTCDTDARFVRRLAGHVETGHPSTSDPAIATH
ncbi:phosphocholine-specific phospholipase C [Streptantibioticus cattleyicolor]|uniref:phospholipase C n=1 Tax=Streptantibioticus cattleyicolor (strain ATCC 35852 / DSM 46488 / JCM 4925 / NBRC 14057 / NRRL 8057) TaxID=1003195 RepID=F8JJE0_STREN|nr:phospholipase C, phosphocholine-specific [Streptantibioticus cattleyicolor]AEW98738.1 non-hemolytic phospholipase C [Streptantibioticus cattleyicolor NRRL 8057 = DSM 46488]CCB72210.1 Non-hemolytic phospholipase C [Streptantibioticus cattleyicolor NRRL 8057 = DSM 46488]